jgi:tetratricopeptide (TPR) repeat protein
MFAFRFSRRGFKVLNEAITLKGPRQGQPRDGTKKATNAPTSSNFNSTAITPSILPQNGLTLSSSVSSLDSQSPTAGFQGGVEAPVSQLQTQRRKQDILEKGAEIDWQESAQLGPEVVETSTNGSTNSDIQNNKKPKRRMTTWFKSMIPRTSCSRGTGGSKADVEQRRKTTQPVQEIMTPQKQKRTGPLDQTREGQLYPSNADEHFDKGCRLWQEHEFEEARLELQKALKIQEIKFHDKQRQRQLLSSKRGADAVGMILGEDEDDQQEAVDRAKTHYSLGMVHFYENHHAEALGEFRTSLRLFCLHLGGDDILSKASALRICDVLQAYTKLHPTSANGSSSRKEDEHMGKNNVPHRRQHDGKAIDTGSNADADRRSLFIPSPSNKKVMVAGYLRSLLISIGHEKKGDAAMKKYDEAIPQLIVGLGNSSTPDDLFSLALSEYRLAMKRGPQDYHPHLALLHQKVAEVYAKHGLWQQSSEEYCNALVIYTSIFGCKHHDTLECLKQFSQATDLARLTTI